MRKNAKGFTLPELLIVVAIIGILVAISVPIFSSQLEKSRDAVSIANLRSAYAEAQTEYLTCTTKDNRMDSRVHSYAVKNSDGKIIKTVNFQNGSIYQICIMNVEIAGKKQNSWNGINANLPFPVEDNHVPGKWMLVFYYKPDGSLEKATVNGMPQYIIDSWK